VAEVSFVEAFMLNGMPADLWWDETGEDMKNEFGPRTLKFFGGMGLALWLTLPVPAGAQQAAGSVLSADDSNQQLLQRIKDLEAKVKELEERDTAAAAAPAIEPPAVNEVAPRLKLVVFGDVGASVYNHVPDSFEFGSLDLFMTARLTNKVSTLGEALFIAQSDNSVGVDVERLLLRYRQSDYFMVSIGRYHTWVGYYNTAFNKGEFLETTTDRPFVYAFDDQGGVLPMQDVGVNVTGRIPSGKLGLNYMVEVGNGRAWGLNAEPAQNSQDQNNDKAINGGLFMRPEKLSGLQVGFSLRYDASLTIPGAAVSETIGTVHGVFVDNNYEILNEGVLVRHTEAGGRVFSTDAFYSQFSRRFGAFRPYFRYQYFNAPSDDPVYVYASPSEVAPLAVTTFIGRINGPSAGIRYDFTAYSAIKLQYDRFSLRGLPTENGLTLQVAFTF
jgi:hypothetical protein